MKYSIQYTVMLFLLTLVAFIITAQETSVDLTDNQGVAMVFVEGGTFEVGITESEYTAICADLGVEDCILPNIPVDIFSIMPYELTVEDFYIDKYEVSIANYLHCVDNDVCSVRSLRNVVSYPMPDRSLIQLQYPMTRISYYDAAIYCAWRGARIPDIQEWLYAAIGTSDTIYPWGNQFQEQSVNGCDENCVFSLDDTDWNDGYDELAPVNEFETGISPFGVFNMSGNAAEWTRPGWSPSGRDLSAIYGGSYRSQPQNLAVQVPYFTAPDIPAHQIGFRCLRTTSPEI